MPRRTKTCRVTVSKHAQRRYQQYGGRNEFLSNRRVRRHVLAAQRGRGLPAQGEVFDVEIGEGMKARVRPRRIGGWMVVTVIPPPGVEREIDMYEITVPGRPVPKARPRVVREEHQDLGGWEQFLDEDEKDKRKARAYTPAKTQEYEEQVGWEARAQIPEPLDGPVSMKVDIHVRDKRHGDLDNYYKSIKDALNGIAYEDDKQVLHIEGRIYFSEDERAEIKVGELDE